MRRILLRMGVPILCVMLALPLLCGCGGTRTVYVKPGESVRLRETVRAAKIWALDRNNKEIPGEMDLPEGWFALPDPGVK